MKASLLFALALAAVGVVDMAKAGPFLKSL
jgi:hypothetical protein